MRGVYDCIEMNWCDENTTLPAPAEGEADFWRRIEFRPDAKQRKLVEGDPHRVILNCTRQWGKSTVTAAVAVKRAVEAAESLTLVLSPSRRQSGEFLRKAKGFVRRLGMRTRGGRDE